ncbi:unnamed protein product [Penicillium salamii]|uniref:RING-CH-type domain-containing protein n=1 Tax=Penicillium salamii TaxID=1612424 RepID=A0A9W4JEU3_9EURO|nr:unnamed protein product [Penicillium salamii]CAG8383761.1 unnamed protein product [Penicillium salamii]CAG8388027.1 unnamed protein product [Penicillium salamii]CAG8402602.1 unnamed protein product [Penicillium salamii]CAG8691491.1 unnamed protein product [Penicillium salamii]
MANYGTQTECWICYQDDTKEECPSSVWSSPCPCGLKAHESCLLAWISHLQSNPAIDDRHASGVVCPCCRMKIRFIQPHTVLGNIFLAVERAVYLGTVPSMGFLILCLLLAGCYVHGSLSLYLMFGFNQQDRQGINRHLLPALMLPATAILRSDHRVANFAFWLVLLTGVCWGRSQIVFGHVTPIQGGILLSGLRLMYQGLHLNLVSGAERRWRATVADFMQTHHEIPQAGFLFRPKEQRITVNVVSYEVNVLLAFVMPALFGGMGDLLNLVLSTDWTIGSSDVGGRQITLLQSRGGRSIIGGCIFICLKDALILCCTWYFCKSRRKCKIFDHRS